MSIESLDEERNDFVAIGFGQLDSSAEANALFHRIFHEEKNDFVADEVGQLNFRRKPSASANAFSCSVGGWVGRIANGQNRKNQNMECPTKTKKKTQRFAELGIGQDFSKK